MASPMARTNSGNWGDSQRPMAANENEEFGLQVRPMGLKVHYTFDRESAVGCLARHPQIMQIQTIALDEKTSIGIVDLRVCLQAIAKCSPELVGQECDYTVYAYDYSEPDVPLVGQGMLSWVLETSDMPESQPKMVVGRVTKNVLAMFSSGIKETLEVKFKLTATSRIPKPESTLDRPLYQRAQSSMSVDIPSQPRQTESAMTPTGIAEWNSFVQSNPQLSNPGQVVRSASPALPQQMADLSRGQSRRGSFNVIAPQQMPSAQQPTDGLVKIAPTLVGPEDLAAAKAPSRPVSRASSRGNRRPPTGRPRGRPKKKPADVPGNTSGYEDGTDGDEGPAKKKRATVQAVKKDLPNPFAMASDSLRVAANMAGSLRNLRPVGGEAPPGNHLQEIPRAPTPIPDASKQARGGKVGGKSSLRRESTLSQAPTPLSQPSFCEMSFAMSPSQEDGRSPMDSEGASPMFSDDSQAGIGSSPPVPRTTNFVRSSPPPSSPILPPMPMPQPDSGFMSGDMEDLFGGESKKAPKAKAPATAPAKPKRARNSSKIPIQVFHVNDRLPPPSSDAEFASLNNYGFGHLPTSTPYSHEQPPPFEQPRANSLVESESAAASPPPKILNPEASSRPGELMVPADDSVEDLFGDDAAAPPEATTSESPADNADKILENEAPKKTTAKSGFTPPLPLPLPLPATEKSTMVAVKLPATEPGAIPRPPVARSKSVAPLDLPLPQIPASDPIGPLALPAAIPATSFSEAPCPPSDAMPPPDSPPGVKANKNLVKKLSIKSRLEKAIENGEMPPFCNNCGAIETPTWRKIWTQDRAGVPEYHELSDKPGRVTAIVILERDEEEKITAYQIIKKALAPNEEKVAWNELLLCNPCGIWLSKWKAHRPPDKWDKDYERLMQSRKPKGSGRAPRPPRRPKNSTAQINPTSEAYFTTDPVGPEDQGSSPKLGREPSAPIVLDGGSTFFKREDSQLPIQDGPNQSRQASPGSRSQPGSTHSRGSGTAKSPITLDMGDTMHEDMGTTRRLLFPSPRKDGNPKVLSEVAVNIVQTGPESCIPKEMLAEKENVVAPQGGYQPAATDDDELEALFRSPAIPRPSTPPPKDGAANQNLFKTPTRPTPSHRPVTRSISRSLRSNRSLKSPSQQELLQRTPTRTPRSARHLMAFGSASVRRSPRIAHNSQFDESLFESPMTRSIKQFLSETQHCDFGGMDLDLNNLPPLDNSLSGMIDFGNLLSTDAVMPSSPPGNNRTAALDTDFGASGWAQWSTNQTANADKMEE